MSRGSASARRPADRLAAGLACLAVLAAACATEPASGPPSRTETNVQPTGSIHSRPNGPVRTDLAPLPRRFPALGTPVSASWQSGELGDGEVPGPSSYWIDAVVTLTPEAARALRASGPLRPSDPPEVTADLRAALPQGPWLAGPDLDRVVSGANGYHSRTLIGRDADVVVLIAEGASG